MRDDGDPIDGDELDRRPADRGAQRDVLWLVGLFATTVLVNAILAILGIEALQALGVWPTPEASPRTP